MFESALVARLDPIISNLYPGVAPLDFAPPCAVYQVSNSQPYNDLSDDIDVSLKTLHIDVYSPSYLTSLTLAKAIRSNLVSWHDDDVQAVTWIDESDIVDETTELKLYRRALVFHVVAAV